MLKPVSPPDEVKRLETLRSLNLLDSPPKERFDRITRLAKKVFDVPIALVSLVDSDRQWFLSAFGLEFKQTSRDVSFCGHAILGDGLFIVKDALMDERFFDNPLVTQAPHIRFYAAYPISVMDGSKVGTLCLFDRQPRDMSDEEIALLKDLAEMVAQEINVLQLTTHDELTNIANRRGFNILAEYALSVCKRENMPASLIYIDLNNFKQINDTFGHAEGDRALQDFSHILKSLFRQSDVIARIGGDEFAILFPHCPLHEGKVNLDRLTEALGQFNEEGMKRYQIKISAGLVEYHPDQHASISDLLHDADQQMYKQKR
jgi:diguanylate cyclase (GGDEF)-like protein